MNIKLSEENSLMLDFFRGISAQIVLIGHLISFAGFQEKYNIPIIQNFGVIIFFILSGFIISYTTFIKGHNYTFKDFVADRFSRVYFSFIPALLFVLLIDLYLNYSNFYEENYILTTVNFFGNVFQLQAFPYISYFGVEAFGSARPFWTISIEWWFYIFFGFVYYKLYLNNRITIISIVLLLISLIFVLDNINGRGNGLTIIWFLGFILFYTYSLKPKISFKKKFSYYFILSFLTILILIRLYNNPKMYDIGAGIIFCIIILLLLNQPLFIKRIIISRFKKFSKFIASFSYSLYLIHYTLIELFRSFLDLNLNTIINP